jgi:hypothetical protein
MTEYKKAHERYEAWLLNGWNIGLPTQEEHKFVKSVDTSILGAEVALRHPFATAQNSEGEEIAAVATI